MGLFGRHKKKKKNKNENIDNVDELDTLSQEIEEPIAGGHLVLEHCQQIIEYARELENGRREYKLLTEYLTDIETIADLSPERRAPIRECAEVIKRLKASREEYLNTSKKITDEQFNRMAEMENEVVDVIKKMQSNETYQNTIKHDMGYLEGEKLQWTKRRDDFIREKKLLKTGALVALGIFVLTMIILLVLWGGFNVDILLPMQIVVLLGAVAGFFIMVRYINAGTEIKKAKVNADRAISLLNRTKIKYVNITNAVEYSLEKYSVKSARELEYIWEQYMEAVRQQERYDRNSDELEFYVIKLMKLLKPLALYDPKVWKDRAVELINTNELSELKHNYLERRRKIGSNIEYNMNIIEEEKTTVERIVAANPKYREEVDEIFASVEKIVGSVEKEK